MHILFSHLDKQNHSAYHVFSVLILIVYLLLFHRGIHRQYISL